MITNFFSKDQPIIWFTWPLIVFLLWTPSFFTVIELNTHNGIGIISYFIEAIYVNNWLPIVVTALVITFQGYHLKFIISKQNLINTNSFYIPLIYGLTLSIFQFDIVLNPLLLTSTFLFFAFDRLLELGKENKRLTVFEAGLIIGISGILYYPLIFFIFICWIALFLFKSFDLKEWTHPLIGLALPFIYLFSYWFWNDRINTSTSELLNNMFSTYSFNSEVATTTSILGRLWLALMMLISFNSFLLSLRSNVMRKKNSHLFFIWIVLICFITSMLTNMSLTSFFICATLISTTFFTVMAEAVTKKWIPELIVISGLLLIVVNSLISNGYL